MDQTPYDSSLFSLVAMERRVAGAIIAEIEDFPQSWMQWFFRNRHDINRQKIEDKNEPDNDGQGRQHDRSRARRETNDNMVGPLPNSEDQAEKQQGNPGYQIDRPKEKSRTK